MTRTDVRTTRHPEMAKRRARLLLSVLGIVLVASGIPGTVHESSTSETPSGQDTALHLATIGRIATGVDYYAAVGAELRSRHYPAGSVFNWRTPALYTLLALNALICRAVLAGLAVVVLFGAVKILNRLSLSAVIVGALLQSGVLGTVADDSAWMFHEVWAGMFIALSAVGYGLGFRRSGAALAVAALFLRELAAPYVALCGVLAVKARRKGEVAALALGTAFYAIHYARHVRNVMAHQQPDDIAHAGSYIQWGGLDFVVATLRTSNLLNDMPGAILACALTLLVAGMMHERLDPHLRGAAGLYVVLFLVVGQPFNWYWGWVPGMVFPLVMAHGMVVIHRLILDAAGRQRRIEAFPG